jgi:hypothetical protein
VRPTTAPQELYDSQEVLIDDNTAARPQTADSGVRSFNADNNGAAPAPKKAFGSQKFDAVPSVSPKRANLDEEGNPIVG